MASKHSETGTQYRTLLYFVLRTILVFVGQENPSAVHQREYLDSTSTQTWPQKQPVQREVSTRSAQEPQYVQIIRKAKLLHRMYLVYCPRLVFQAGYERYRYLRVHK